ncbi:alpha/beta fold hydrolase [Streptomyces sp. DSM 42041]|uniref:Alpha/beta fold hydrolase n=1 Tax=Streptomyces hazeniae TaxID=3075538 RepID=A0ABU2NL25_9ACTN|nr:alpha/beta fold hydrolase [Streptomyces sp. DSM 42041]MDT0377690.1 alpha/beta fold hydrolase [Streptomyces sp. DSM 42041]
MNDTATWIRRFFPSDEAAVQLICLPHAGGSAPFYRPVAQALSPQIEVLAVQYPGRQDRRREPMLETIEDLADGVAAAVREAVDRPFALFGHSMGATLAFEVARRLESSGSDPLRIFASGRRAPSTHRDEQVHQRDDDGVIAELRTLSGTDQRVFGDEELLRMVLPAIRNDYRAAETYTCAPDVRVKAPITALTGESDPKASHEEVEAWAGHTEGAFDLRTYPGGHFYLMEHSADVLRVIGERLGAPSAALR